MRLTPLGSLGSDELGHDGIAERTDAQTDEPSPPRVLVARPRPAARAEFRAPRNPALAGLVIVIVAATALLVLGLIQPLVWAVAVVGSSHGISYTLGQRSAASGVFGGRPRR